MSDTVTLPSAEKIAERSTDVPWYEKTIPAEKLDGAARELLENYSKIPPSEVESHVYNIVRFPFTKECNKAWSVFPFPCIGGFRFLDLAIASSPYYPTLLSRLSTSDTKFLDLGCCVGQELRKLVHDGAPSEKLYGCDLRSEFYDVGYDLFKDKDTLKTTFLTADIFDEENEDLKKLEGDIDVVYAGSFLHLFGWDDQVKICKRLTKILKKEGSVVMGRQVGEVTAGERTHTVDTSRTLFVHNKESFERMWKEVGESTGTKVCCHHYHLLHLLHPSGSRTDLRLCSGGWSVRWSIQDLLTGERIKIRAGFCLQCSGSNSQIASGHLVR
ncbi:methyltransferase domain-containing protein [Rutstroemia sp. NJR-2017a WRK4]|nr:methyltransferase domain-containing protein [Rutstroemia sp. NJR-2017a WRK4]